MDEFLIWIVLGFILAYLLVELGLMIGILSWMTHQKNTSGWLDTYRASTSGANIKMRSLLRIWQRQPLVDVAVTDGPSCPADYPEDVIYQIWLGTRGFCDCLQRGEDHDDGRDYYLNQNCDKTNRDSPTKSEDCNDVGALAPIVQNRIQGVRYCGKRGATSLLETVRPVPIANEDQDANGRKYACPAGYEACNDDWFDQPDGAEFVACKPVGDQDFQCPITSIKFEVTDLERDKFEYEWKGDGKSRGVWVSRSVMQHSLEKITLQPNQPCKDDQLYNAAPNQQFYFAEIQRNFRKCDTEDQYY